MKPSIGRIVHYVTATGVHLPAIIVDVPYMDSCALHVFNHPESEYPIGQTWSVMYNEHGVEGTWHWPEREE